MDRMIQTTSLSDIRQFLMTEQAAPPPWSQPVAAIDSLFGLIQARQDDEPFWARLKTLAARLEDSRFNREGLSQLDILHSASLDQLIDDLRDELGHKPEKGWRSLNQFAAKISITALSGLLFLGLATACGNSGDSGSCADEVEEYGMDETEGELYCAVVDIINSADISSGDRNALLDCMPELDSWDHAYLLDQFQKANDAEIADILEDILRPCNMCDADMSDCH